jgi:hypothetical protein
VPDIDSDSESRKQRNADKGHRPTPARIRPRLAQPGRRPSTDDLTQPTCA